MTCVIGMYFDDGKGALVISDSRIMLGADYSSDRKVHRLDDEVVFASAGLSGIAEKLVTNVKSARVRTRRFLTSEVITVFEDEMADLYERYKMTRPYRFPIDEPLLSGIIGLVEENAQPKLHCLHENGYAEAIHGYRVIGHGEKHAQNILRTLYARNLSKDRALEVGVHTLVEVARLDSSIDNCPQVAVLELDENKKPKVEILNENGDHFDFTVDCLEETKAKLAGIEEKRSIVFHLLLDGSNEVKQQLDRTLQEYKNAKRNTD